MSNASSRHITKLEQSIFVPFDIYAVSTTLPHLKLNIQKETYTAN
jgi:hypothetical protein